MAGCGESGARGVASGIALDTRFRGRGRLADLLLAATDLDAPASWEEWALGALGLWLVVAPWIFGYAANSAMAASSVVTGALVMALATWTLSVAGGFLHRRGVVH